MQLQKQLKATTVVPKIENKQQQQNHSKTKHQEVYKYSCYLICIVKCKNLLPLNPLFSSCMKGYYRHLLDIVINYLYFKNHY